jgi:hypothetical protein
MATFTGSKIKEQGVTFGIVLVKPSVLQNQTEANRLISVFQAQVFGCPTVLMAQDGRGTPTYYGRTDLVRFLANIPMSAISWKEYTLN